MITEQQRIDMYGEMTEQEIDLVYKGIGNYKGWSCAAVGCGHVAMHKNFEVIRAYRGLEVKNWIPECWAEVKAKIDMAETR